MMKSPVEKLLALKASIEMLPPLLEKIQQAVSESRVSSLLSDARYSDARSLIPHRFKVFSQCGQDGMIAEIFRRIGSGNKRFVEIGTAPLENNTGFLLLQGWSGLWLDAALPVDSELPESLRNLLAAGKLSCARPFLTQKNVCSIIAEAGFDRDLDFLGVDVDYNTFHLFKSCLALRPRVFSVEYNGQFPAFLDWVAPYQEKAVWDKTFAYGASLKALENAAREGGYSLVGCELSGTDAFFVRNDQLGDHFLSPYSAERHWEPLRMWLDSPTGHRPGFPRRGESGAD